MTEYVFMSGQSVPTNASNGPTPTPVTIAGMPTRGEVTLSVESNELVTIASLWAQTAVTPYGYTQNIPLITMTIPPGAPPSITQHLALDLQYYNFLFAELNLIDPSGENAATMTMVV